MCAANAEGVWLRLSGIANFITDLAIKQEVLNRSDLVLSIYQSADNPVFEVFYLSETTAAFMDLSGNTPRIEHF